MGKIGKMGTRLCQNGSAVASRVQRAEDGRQRTEDPASPKGLRRGKQEHKAKGKKWIRVAIIENCEFNIKYSLSHCLVDIILYGMFCVK